MKNAIKGFACGFASGVTFFHLVYFPATPQGEGEGFPLMGWWIVGVAAGAVTAVVAAVAVVAASIALIGAAA